MNCPNDGTLQARLDGELPPAEIEELNRHLSSCSACRERAEGLRSQADRVQGALATTSSTVDDIATGAVRYAGSVAKLLG